MIGETAIQRKYAVRVGFTIPEGAFGDNPAAIKCDTVDGDSFYVVPLEEFPVTLTYKPAKANRIDRYSEEAQVEAQDRAIKVWRQRNPEQANRADLIAFDARCQWDRQIVDRIGLQ